MDLRDPNKAAVSKVIQVIAADGYHEVVCDLATGVGNTYIMAALIDYLSAQDVHNVLIVTPGKTIEDKQVANFTPGSGKYVGREAAPLLITAENFDRGRVGEALGRPEILKLFVFQNVQQLIKPSVNVSRRVREPNEFIGADLYSHLQRANDLVIIADEHHVYRTQAEKFSSAVR